MRRGEAVDVDKLKELRIDRGLSQRRLSELAGVSNTTIWHIERGDYNASPATLKKLADVLGVRASELVRERRG
jgi:transcriptional regulator with XRE-family HTH domain